MRVKADLSREWHIKQGGRLKGGTREALVFYDLEPSGKINPNTIFHSDHEGAGGHNINAFFHTFILPCQ